MGNNRLMLISAIFALILSFFAGQAKSDDCLAYEPAKVRIIGKIVRETFPGPPNYHSIAEGDEIETYWILKSENPICVNGKEEYDLDFVEESNVKALQLVFHEDDAYDRYRPFLRERVSVSGTLFHSHTGHHHSRVLLKVTAIKPAN